MDRLFNAQRRLRAFVSRRPWLPWTLPLGFAAGYLVGWGLVWTLSTMGTLAPCDPAAYLTGSIILGLLVLPLYRMTHIHSVILWVVALFTVLVVHHHAVCLFRTVHASLSVPLGVLDGMIILTVGGRGWCHSDNRLLRGMLWDTLTKHLPFLVLPQTLLLLAIHM